METEERNSDLALASIKAKFERKIRREIANNNERRRMHNINSGFDALRAILPVTETCRDKLSKASILRKSVDYVQGLEQDMAALIQQNKGLKQILSESNRADYLGKFRSPVKRKLSEFDTNRIPVKSRKVDFEHSDSESNQFAEIDAIKEKMMDLQCQLDRERRLRKLLQQEREILELKKNECTPSPSKKIPLPLTGARRSLDNIIEAINHLEGGVLSPSSDSENPLNISSSSSSSTSSLS